MNLLQNLDSFLLHKASDSIAGKERSTMSKNHYFKKIAEKMQKFSEKPENWLFEFEASFPERLQVFTYEQKQDLINYLKDLDFQEFSWFMGLLCRMLNYFDQNNELDTPFAQVILADYEYVKLEVFPQLYPEQNRQFNKRLHLTKQQEADRPKCPKCGSNKLISNGISWFCKSCGKQTRKNLV